MIEDNLLELVEELNSIIVEAGYEDLARFKYITDGSSEIITYQDIVVFNEDSDRGWIEDDDGPLDSHYERTVKEQVYKELQAICGDIAIVLKTIKRA